MRALLVSLPWIDYLFPSLQIGTLAAYACQEGFAVEAKHLHLEIAALFGLKDYDNIGYKEKAPLGELFFAALLFPERKELILNYLKRYLGNSKSYLDRLSKVVRNVFESNDWGKYDLVGFTLNINQLFASLLFAKWIKGDLFNTKILFGGPLVAGKLGTSILECFPQVDWCIDGEGEIAFTELLKCLSSGIKNIESHVPGLSYRCGNYVHTNPRQQLLNLDAIPLPDFVHYFSLLENHFLLKNEEVMARMPIESSRGCPYQCAFCKVHIYWDGYRKYSIEKVAANLKQLSNKYCTNCFQFVDSKIPHNYGYELSSLIEQQGRDYNIFYEVRAGISKSELEAMRRSGVCKVQVGIEALSTNLLRKMNKGTRIIDNLQIMKYCEEVGIENVSNLILGFPAESQQDIDESARNIEYAVAYRPPAFLVEFRLDQDIPVYCNPHKYGISKIQNSKVFNHLLPKKIAAKLSMVVKEYKSNRKPSDYRKLKFIYERWKHIYENGCLSGDVLLGYYDCIKYLRIVDYRSVAKVIILEGKARDLYLFCDSIKRWDDIIIRFSDRNDEDIRRILNKLVKLKIMFREGNDYLSLAVHANNGY